MRLLLLPYLLIALLISISSLWAADPELPQISALTAIQDGPRIQVRILASQRPVFSSYQLSDPERLVIDFPQMQLAPQVGPPPLRSVLIDRLSLEAPTDFDNLVRLVIWLRAPADYRMEQQNGSLVIILEPLPGSPLLALNAPQTSQKTGQSETPTTVAATLQAEREDAERKRLEAERRQREIAEQKRLEAERRQREIAEQKRLEAERRQREIAEQKRLEAERRQREIAEQKRLEAERRQREIAEQKRLEAERRQREIAEQKRLEEERRQREIAEQKRLEEERRQREIAEQKRLEEERRLREIAQQKRLEEERRQREEAKKKRLEEERQKRENAQRERMQAEVERAKKAERNRQNELAKRKNLKVTKLHPASGPATLRFVGFHPQNGGARVSVTFNRTANMTTQWVDTHTARFIFAPARVVNRMNLLPLQTAAFNTPVESVQPDWNPLDQTVSLTVHLSSQAQFSVQRHDFRIDILFEPVSGQP